MKYFFGFWVCIMSVAAGVAVTAPVFAQGAALSITPSEVDVQLAPANSHIEQLTVQRVNADGAQTYTATADIPAQLVGVHADVTDVTFAQGQTTQDVSYTLSCDAVCLVASGDVVIRFEPTALQQQNGGGIQAQLGIAQKIHLSVVTSIVAAQTPVVASQFTKTDDDVIFQQVGGVHWLALSQQVALVLSFNSAADVSLAQLPYSAVVYRNGRQVQSQKGICTDLIAAHGATTQQLTQALDGIGLYRIVFTAAGEQHEMTFFYLPSLDFWIVVGVFVGAVIVFWISKLFFRNRTNEVEPRVHVRLWLIILVLGVPVVFAGYVGVASIPRLQQVTAFSYDSTGQPAFILVRDAQRLTMVRLEDGKTDALPGSWNVITQNDDTFYAVPVVADTQTVQQTFYRIRADGIQPMATLPINGQITRVIDNAPGTYAIAASKNTTCIFALADANAPVCQDLSAITAQGAAITDFAWSDDSGQYVTMQTTGANGATQNDQYDVWNHRVVTPSQNSADFSQKTVFKPAIPLTLEPSSRWWGYGATVFGHTVVSPLHLQVTQVSASLSVARIPQQNDTLGLALVNTKNQYYVVLTVSPEATIYYLTKGSLITNPVMLDR